MCWFLYLALFVWFVVSWLVYRCLSSSSSKLPQSLQKITRKGDSVLFVVAHPDDECMFFGPAIVTCTKAAEKRASKINVYIVCLSEGNHYGVGSTRRDEFVESCGILGIPKKNIYVESGFQDNPVEWWNTAAVSSVIESYAKKLRVTQVFTFDDYGVSGHVNHRSLYRAVCGFSQKTGIPCFVLESVSILRKYIGFLDSLMTYLSDYSVYVTAEDRETILAAMKAHASQLVWFRKLYVKFSRYMYFNTFKKI